mmetsp:Transcript_9735/g.28096  ORF Transcript_9735/g.28096 Transcript_9735/m.28096 type:complete len:228 (+) Transcript_9735:1769-2452(+)
MLPLVCALRKSPLRVSLHLNLSSRRFRCPRHCPRISTSSSSSSSSRPPRASSFRQTLLFVSVSPKKSRISPHSSRWMSPFSFRSPSFSPSPPPFPISKVCSPFLSTLSTSPQSNQHRYPRPPHAYLNSTPPRSLLSSPSQFRSSLSKIRERSRTVRLARARSSTVSANPPRKSTRASLSSRDRTNTPQCPRFEYRRRFLFALCLLLCLRGFLLLRRRSFSCYCDSSS